MEAHDKGIEAAIKEGEDIDWVSCLLGTGIGSCQQLFEAQIHAYLSASNQVLVPREPTEEMMRRGEKRLDRGGVCLSWLAMIAAAPNPFKDK